MICEKADETADEWRSEVLERTQNLHDLRLVQRRTLMEIRGMRCVEEETEAQGRLWVMRMS